MGLMVKSRPILFLHISWPVQRKWSWKYERAQAIKCWWNGYSTLALLQPIIIHSDLIIAPSQSLLLAWSAISTELHQKDPEGKTSREDLKVTPYKGMEATTKNAAIIMGTLEGESWLVLPSWSRTHQLWNQVKILASLHKEKWAK